MHRPLAVFLVVLPATLVAMYAEDLVFPMALMPILALFHVGRSCSLRIVTACTVLAVATVYVTVDFAKDIEHFDLSSANQLGWFVTAAAGVAAENQLRAPVGGRRWARRAEESRQSEARRRVSDERLRIAQGEVVNLVGGGDGQRRDRRGAGAVPVDGQDRCEPDSDQAGGPGTAPCSSSSPTRAGC